MLKKPVFRGQRGDLIHERPQEGMETRRVRGSRRFISASKERSPFVVAPSATARSSLTHGFGNNGGKEREGPVRSAGG